MNQQPDERQARHNVESYNKHSEPDKENWLTQLLRAYMRIPLMRKIDPVKLCMFLVILLIETAVVKLMPPGWPLPVPECTCEDQYSDAKLQALAKAGNEDVKRYLAQKDNPINCAGRRKELLEQLEKAKKKNHP